MIFKWYSALLLHPCLILSLSERHSQGGSVETHREIVCRESLNWSSPSDPSPWRLGILAEEGEDCNRQGGWGTPEEHGPPNEARVTRARWDWSGKHRVCMGLHMVLWVHVIAGSFVFVGLLTVEKGGFSNSFACSRYSVFPIELPCLASIGWPFALSYCFLLYLIWLLSLRLLFSVKEMKEECIWGGRLCQDGRSGVRETVVRIYSMSDVSIFNKNIHFGKPGKIKRVWPICLNWLPQEWSLFFAALLPFSVFTNL